MAASINIKVNSDFAQASKDLQKFGNVSEAEAKRVKKFTESFKTEKIDSFIEKNRRTGAAVLATSGDMKSLTVQQAGLTRQMESLIKKGMDPQDESIEKLRKEYDRLDKEVVNNTNSQKGMEVATKAATAGLLAIAAAATAAALGALKSTVEIGKMGDEYAKTSAKIGVGVESFQELAFAAERSGLSSGSLSGVFEKLNKNVGDLQAGTGALTTYLNASNPALLDQLSTVTDTEEAFNILTGAIADAPTEFEKAALAQAAFGRSGQDIINFANQGTEEISKLREQAASYGVISAKVAKQGEDFADAQRNVEQATIGARSELAGKLLPTFTSVLNGFADFIADGEKLEKTISMIGYALAGVTAGLVAFMIVAKGAAAIQALATAFRVLTAAMASNPIGAVAVAITAVLIPAIIWLIKNWDLVVVIMSTTIEKLKERFSSFAATISMLWTKAISGIKILFLELAGIVLNKVLGAVNAFLDVAKELPFVGDKFADLQGTVNGLAGELDEARVAAINQSRDAVAAAEAQQAAVKRQTTENIARIEEEKQARLAALETASNENAKTQEDLEKAQEEHEQNITDIQTTALSSRLEVLNNVEAQARIDNLATFDEFLSARMEQEAIAGENRVAFLQEELDRIRELTNISAEERVAAEATVAEQIKQIQDEQRASEAAARVAQIKGYADMFGTMSNIMSVFAGENAAAASGMKMLAAAQAGINSYLAFTQVLADPTLPFLMKAISATSVLASGLSQQKNIMSTSVSAETGGEFTVPDSGRVDSAALMVNQGEKVAVTPRGETSSSSMTTNVHVDKEMIWSVVQDGLDQNEINVTNDNVRSA